MTVAWKKTTPEEDVDGAELTTAGKTVQVEYTVTTSPSAGPVFVSSWGGAAAGTWTQIHGSKTCTLTLPVSSV